MSCGPTVRQRTADTMRKEPACGGELFCDPADQASMRADLHVCHLESEAIRSWIMANLAD